MESDNQYPRPYEYGPLSGQLATVIDRYVQAREDYWRSRKEGKDWNDVTGIMSQADTVAKAILAETTHLVSPDILSDKGEQFFIEYKTYLNNLRDEIDNLWKIVKGKLLDAPGSLKQAIHHMVLDDPPNDDDSLLTLIWERLCIHLARETVENKLIQGSNRILQLVELVIRVDPNPSTLAFLERISRCFIWGFDSECILLCRGAIDSQFLESVPDEICKKYGPPKAKFGYTLTQRIEAAAKEVILDKKGTSSAYKVNTPATTVAHESPIVDVNSLDIIHAAIEVICQLSKKSKGHSNSK